jgi:hypothetical protein
LARIHWTVNEAWPIIHSRNTEPEKIMNTPSADTRAACATQQNLNGCWKLDAGRAVTLHPTAAGVLNIARGRVWATLDGPHVRLTGDLFLEAGETLRLQAGQRVVIEPFGATGQGAAAFDWVPARASQTSRWPAAVAQPASDLRLALGSAGIALRGAAGALVRLAGGLLGLAPAGVGAATDWVARRDRLALGTLAFNAHSSESRAQGCMN